MCIFAILLTFNLAPSLIPLRSLIVAFKNDINTTNVSDYSAQNNFIAVLFSIIAYTAYSYWLSSAESTMVSIGRDSNWNMRDEKNIEPVLHPLSQIPTEEDDDDEDEDTTSSKTIAKVMKFLGIFIVIFLIFPLSWLLSFSYTVFSANGFVLATDHLLYSIITFSLLETIDKCAYHMPCPIPGYSNAIAVLTRFCVFYGALVIACCSLFLAFANDVMMIFVYKSVLLLSHYGMAHSVVLDRANIISSSLADYLVDTTFALYDPENLKLAYYLASQTAQYRSILVDSLWTMLFWIMVIVPFVIGSLVLKGHTMRAR